MIDNPEERNELQAVQRAALEQMLSGRLEVAVRAREQSGIEDIWREAEDLYNGVDDLTDGTPVARPSRKDRPFLDAKQSAPNGRSRININITKPKTDAAVSRVQELALPTDDRPWRYDPTPVPDIEDAAKGNDPRMLTTADGQQVPAAVAAKALIAQARAAADKMQDQVEDWLQEGSVYAELRKVIRDAGRLGTGVIKGPFPTMRKRKTWVESPDGIMEIRIEEVMRPASKAVSCWDIFPDPSCGESIHEGAYLIERDYLTGKTLRGLAAQPDYDQAAIVECLREGPKGPSRYDDRETRETPGQTSAHDRDTYEAFYYYGDLDPETLLSGGWVIPGLTDAEDDQAKAEQLANALQMITIPVVVMMVNGRIVRVTMNPLETGEFPFDVFAWEPMVGQPWGRGIPTKMAPAAKMLTAATRAMLENAGLSAGPLVVVNRELVEPADGKWAITGRKLFFLTPDADGEAGANDINKAFATFQIQSAQQELQAIIEYALSLADQLTNLPLLLQGTMGQAPETVGGMAMLQNNATSPLKAIAKGWDDGLCVPHLRRYYDWAMQDPEVPQEAKGDMQTVPRTSTALIQRDAAAQLLPQLLPYVKDPDFQLDPRKYIEELLRANKFSPDAVSKTEEQIKAEQEAAAQNPPPADPRVEAANIKAAQDDKRLQAELADRQQDRDFEAQQNAEERAHQRVVADLEFQIQAMEYAGQKEITFDQLKAMLAAKAMDIKTKREMFAAERALKLDPQNPTNQGL